MKNILASLFLSILVFDFMGNEIETMVYAVHKPGSYYYSFSPENLQSGPYFYTLITDNHILSRVMLIE